MKVLIVFGTTDGQTAKVARHALGVLAEAGHSAALVKASDFGDLDVAAFDAAIIAGSVHLGRYQTDLVDVVATHAAALSERPNLFLSVSLSAASDDADDRAGLRACVRRFSEETGWIPDRIEHVAGAFRFTGYDFFRYWAMRWIEDRKDRSAPQGEDREYTDWAALTAAVLDWTGALESDT